MTKLTALLFVAATFWTHSVARAELAADLPGSVAALRHGGPLGIVVRTDLGNDVALELQPFYTTQTLGAQLSTTQLDQLAKIRREAPEKFALLAQMFPRHIAEFLLRTDVSRPSAPTPVAAPNGEVTMVVVPRENHAASMQTVAARDAGFDSPQKVCAFLALQKDYDPNRSPGMSIIGDTLCVDGKIVTDHLRAAAAAAGMDPEDFADGFLRRVRRALARQKAGDLSDAVAAQTMLNFLKDARLASFTREEKQRAFQQVFHRDLGAVAEQAEREAAARGGAAGWTQLGLIQ